MDQIVYLSKLKETNSEIKQNRKTYFMKVSIAAQIELAWAEEVWGWWFSECGPLHTEVVLLGNRVPHKLESKGFSKQNFSYNFAFWRLSCASCKE